MDTDAVSTNQLQKQGRCQEEWGQVHTKVITWASWTTQRPTGDGVQSPSLTVMMRGCKDLTLRLRMSVVLRMQPQPFSSVYVEAGSYLAAQVAVKACDLAQTGLERATLLLQPPE